MGIEVGRIVHADENNNELGFIDNFFFFDCTLSRKTDYAKNSFVLSLPKEIWEECAIAENHYIYIPGTEYGGRVGRIRNVGGERVELEGPGVRGHMGKWLVQPATGQDYFVLPATEANAAIALLAQGHLVNYFDVSTDNSEFTISGSYRYQTVHDAINDALDAQSARLNIAYAAGGIAEISAVAITDYSRDYDFSQDYGARLDADKDGSTGFNSIVALGQGELADRQKVVLYLWNDGTISTVKSSTKFPTNLADVREYLYENSGVDNITELTREAEEQLREVGDRNTVGIDLQNLDVELQLGDIVAARDRVTGLYIKDSIYSKILRIEGGATTLNYTVRGDEIG